MVQRAFLISIIIFAAVASPCMAMDYMVGDDKQWALGVNYTEWAQEKDFHVGDTIMFMYEPGSHNVLTVNVEDFQKCTSSNTSSVPMISGNDTITLTTPGKKWYICDINDHCKNGMKLSINVLSAIDGPTPAPEPTSEAYSLRSCIWTLVLVAVFKIIKAL